MTPYRLAKDSGGRISLSTAYRLCRLNGRLESFEAAALDALCDVLQVSPGDLFEREPARSGRGILADIAGAKRRSASSKSTRRAR